MRAKLTLKLEDLAVDSFDTSAAQKEKGTVFGEQGPCTCLTACTCPGCLTCDHTACGQQSCETCDSCLHSCEASCQGTCAPECSKYTDCNDICW
jgi:hypothetical protein